MSFLRGNSINNHSHFNTSGLSEDEFILHDALVEKLEQIITVKNQLIVSIKNKTSTIYEVLIMEQIDLQIVKLEEEIAELNARTSRGTDNIDSASFTTCFIKSSK